MQPDLVELRIGGLVHSSWTSYSIDSDIMTPADAWQVKLSQPEIDLPAAVTEGAQVELRLGGDVVLHGMVDERSLEVAAGQHELVLSGRDRAGVLLDCSSPIFSSSLVSLDKVVAQIVAAFGIVRKRVDAHEKFTRDKVSIEPGDTAWDSLKRAAEANGLWPWFEPDGTLVVSGPDYNQPSVATLVLRKDGKGNNVLRLAEKRSIVERFSEVKVFGQSTASGTGSTQHAGQHNLVGGAKDTGVSAYRPKVVVDHEAVNKEIADAKGLKIISDGRIKSYTLTATVKGHRTDKGLLWTPGQRVKVQSEPHKIDGVYFLMGRRFTSDKVSGQRTVLTLKEDGVWLPQAHPSTRRHRRGKNSLPGRIIDLGGSK